MGILMRFNPSLIRKLWKRHFQLRRFIYALLFVTVLLMIQSVIFWQLEKDVMPDIANPFDSLFWITIFLLSGAEIIPTTIGGRVITLCVIVEGVFITTYFIAIVVILHIKGGGGHMHQKFRNHIIICEWTKRAKRLIEELTSPKIKHKREIVLLVNMEKNPYPEGDFVFISGDPTNEKDLKKAGIESAATAVILIDEESKDPDGKALLSVLAIETLNRNVYTIVEIINPDNKKHFQRANADEIICQPEFGDYIVTQSCVNPRLSEIFSDLLTYEYGNEVYKIKVPQGLVGKKFVDALKVLGDMNIILIGLERNEDVKCNPNKDTILKENDYLFVISEEEPSEKDLTTLSPTL